MDDGIVNTVDECQEACYDDGNCLWYTFDSTLNYCLLTSDCTPRNTSVPKVFGQKTCFQVDEGNPSISYIKVVIK